ncbi:DUF4349 domain-containing protein [Nonlabens xiamenensis]|uniref:DUF4349 domain-containing protein n=1 Tax=Nonlabens xiamenensis TaxID=2341043 RepID=UPI000F607436|nr:DUF4349 domain-containing protein [Nonlabens xiamenensis]
MKNTFLSLLVMPILINCTEAYHPEMNRTAEAITTEEADINIPGKLPNVLTSTASPSAIKIVKNANVRCKVSHLDSVTRQVQRITSQNQGYIAEMLYSQNQYNLENKLLIKVPSGKFDPVFEALTELADVVEYKNITTKDITSEYVDLKTRLATKKEVKLRYDQILRSKAKTIDEVLNTEEKLRVLQEEIESAEGRLRFMDEQISYSRIDLLFYQPLEIEHSIEQDVKTYTDRAVENLSIGWGWIKNFSLTIMVMWPIVLLGLLGYSWYRWRGKARKKV